MQTRTFWFRSMPAFFVIGTVVCAQTTQPTTAPTTQPTTQQTTQPATQPDASAVNPPADGFNLAGSDAKAIELADLTVEAMGGRKAWDETRYIAWNFFGIRKHIWDKHTGNLRLEYINRDTNEPVLLLMNIRTETGRAWINGKELTDALKARAIFRSGYAKWVNDSYWLFMPCKLKDTGVTLKYKGPAKMEDGRDADVITVTFDKVGITPNNKYDVYISQDTRLVSQWSFYETREHPTPGFTTPWGNWKKYGRIMLSDDRGENYKLGDVAVFDELPASVFTSPEPVDLSALLKKD